MHAVSMTFLIICLFFRYSFPRVLLSRQFWTEEQRKKFNVYYHKHRLSYFPGILKTLEHRSKHIEEPGYKDKLDAVLEKVFIHQLCLNELGTILEKYNTDINNFPNDTIA